MTALAQVRTDSLIAADQIRAGGCAAWLLPADERCAGLGRTLYRETVNAFGVPADLVYDQVTMVSELVTNTLDHALAESATGGAEMWLYERGHGMFRQLVCKVFDPSPYWNHSGITEDCVLTEGGRGLGVVDELSGGCWGRHRSRARLGPCGTQGKVVWFGFPSPLGDTGRRVFSSLSPEHTARELEDNLNHRGIAALGGGVDHGTVTLSLRSGLTVYCRRDTIEWDTSTGRRAVRHVSDLTDISEEIVRAFEEMDTTDAELGRRA